MEEDDFFRACRRRYESAARDGISSRLTRPLPVVALDNSESNFHRHEMKPMTKRNALLTSALLISSLCGTEAALAQDLPAAPPLVKQINNGNWLSQSEAEAMRDELYYQRAVQTYMSMLPALNTIGMRDGS